MSLCEKPLYLTILTFLTIRKCIEERRFILFLGECMLYMRVDFAHVSLQERARLKDTLRSLVGVFRVSF